jgi:hypothetical protein
MEGRARLLTYLEWTNYKQQETKLGVFSHLPCHSRACFWERDIKRDYKFFITLVSAGVTKTHFTCAWRNGILWQIPRDQEKPSPTTIPKWLVSFLCASLNRFLALSSHWTRLVVRVSFLFPLCDIKNLAKQNPQKYKKVMVFTLEKKNRKCSKFFSWQKAIQNLSK